MSATREIQHVHVAAGRYAHLGGNGDVQALAIRAASPRILRAAVGRRGVEPVNGYYLVFKVSLVDVGVRPITIAPGDFVVYPGRFSTISGDGFNSYFPSQLLATTLGHGQHFEGEVSFDVSHRHGRLVFATRSGSRVVWRF